MKPQRPYLLRALYEWLVDSNDVPYILVDAHAADVQVPTEHVKDGQIVLNLGPEAVRDLALEQDYVMCSSRFSGRAYELYLPMASIRAIYGRDTRQGMVFPEEEFSDTAVADNLANAAPDEAGKPDKAQKADNPEKKGGSDKPPLRLV